MASSDSGILQGTDVSQADEYVSQSRILKEFVNSPSVDNAWIFKSEVAETSRAMFSFRQPDLMANKQRTLILSTNILRTRNSVNFQWSPFPIELVGASKVVPSPSGAKFLIIRNKENESSVHLEIWSQSQLEMEIQIPQSVHGTIYTDGWFEGISWDDEETHVAYVAEEPSRPKPVFDALGVKIEGPLEKDFGSWKGQGDWEENWGETYSKKRNPSLFVVNIKSGEVRSVEGISKSLSVGQVVWAPSLSTNNDSYLVFVGWSAENGPQQTWRKLGIKYCYNRPSALYSVKSPFQGTKEEKQIFGTSDVEDQAAVVKLSHGLCSAFSPQFSPDGKFLLFISSKSAVESGAHSATNSLHRMNWHCNEKGNESTNIIDVIPVVMCANDDDSFPGLYCTNFVKYPWLSDGHTMILSSSWHSKGVIIAINVLSCKVSLISPKDSNYSWDFLALDGDSIVAVSSSPIDPPQIKYGYWFGESDGGLAWSWLDVRSPLQRYTDKIRSLLSSHKCNILKIPVNDGSANLSRGANKPYEAIFVSCSNSTSEEPCANMDTNGTSNPLILILHGGPHSVSLSSYSNSWAFLSYLGYNLLIVNYRGSLGFGEEALQSLPGNVGNQDVNDVLVALDFATLKGYTDASKVAVFGGSHGGFLTTHLIGQASHRFVAAVARNPVCNLSIMLGTTDIPDWCYFEAYGSKGKDLLSEVPSAEQLNLLYSKSPVSHISKVKTPILFLLGAQDLRVPISNGLQYARALKEKGVDVKIIVFPEDCHGIERPQSDFESLLNIGLWFKKHLN